MDESGISSDNTVVSGLGNGDGGDNGLSDSWDGICVVDKWGSDNSVGSDNRVDSWDSVGVEESWISLGLSLSIVDCGSNCVDNWGVDSVDTSIGNSRGGDSVGVGDWGMDSLEGGSWGQGRDEWGADDGVNSWDSTGVDESWVSLGFSISRSLSISPSGGVSIWSVGTIGIWSVGRVSVDSIESISISLWLSISRSLSVISISWISI